MSFESLSNNQLASLEIHFGINIILLSLDIFCIYQLPIGVDVASYSLLLRFTLYFDYQYGVL